MTVSDARRLQVYEQAREHWGEGPAEALMELVVPAGQDMATKADIDAAVVALCAGMDRVGARMAGIDARMDGIDAHMDGLAAKEYVLRMLLIALTPLYLGMLGLSLGVAGLYFTG